MCGLVGVFGHITHKMDMTFCDLLNVDVIRGDDSTGVASVIKGEAETNILKGAVLPAELMGDAKFLPMMRKNNILLMGHNRSATVGFVDDANSHPFVHGSITLAHNGTLKQVRSVPEGNDFITDSEAICNAINQWGVEDVWPCLDGAATLTFWDAINKTFNIVSNGKRPFHWVYNEDKTAMIYASEAWMIRGVAERHKLKLKDGMQVWYPPDNTLFSFSYGKVGKDKLDTVSFESKTLESFSWKKVIDLGFPGVSEPEKNILPPYADPYSDEWMYESWGDYHNSLEKDKPKKNNVVPITLEGVPETALNRNLTIAQFREKYHQCMICDSSLFADYGSATILDENLAVCEECDKIADNRNLSIKRGS